MEIHRKKVRLLSRVTPFSSNRILLRKEVSLFSRVGPFYSYGICLNSHPKIKGMEYRYYTNAFLEC
jgi:hypothetical protein